MASIISTIPAPADRPTFGEWWCEIRGINPTAPLLRKLNDCYEFRKRGVLVKPFAGNPCECRDIQRPYEISVVSDQVRKL